MTDYRSGEAQLIQFVREKGKRVPKILADGKIARDNKGKIVMVREKGLPRGFLVAGMVDGTVRIGWSYTNKKMGDKFDKERGMDIAVGRMATPSPIDIVPHKIIKEIENTFLPRVEKYFNVKID
jgi:hypothetical protein